MVRLALAVMVVAALPALGGEPRPARRATGIGPLNIPVPPSRVANPRPDGQTWAQWYQSLTKKQRAYFDRYCAREENGYTQLCGGTPLVAVFDGRPVTFGERGVFAFTPGLPVASAFPAPRTPWLARDLDGDGLVGSGAELFGSNTLLAGGRLAEDGFEALAALDANGDGVVDARDPAFGELLLWADADGDHRCSKAEVRRLSERVTSISLSARALDRCDAQGNCEALRSSMRWRDDDGELHDGAVADVWLRYEPVVALAR